MTQDESIIARTLGVAERVAELVHAEGGHVAVIGAIAMAAHRYPRATRDLDLATVADPFTTLAKVAAACRAEGWDAKLITPDGEDPLGGVLTITGGDFRPVQLVNFYNPLRPRGNPGAAAIEHSTPTIQGTSLAVVDLPHLIALKLYAGGPKNRADVIELLARNPDADLASIDATCARFGLDEELRLAQGATPR
jgi:hypothetical protein